MTVRKLTVLAGAALVALSLACSSMAGLLPGEDPTPTPTETPAIFSSEGSGNSGQGEDDAPEPQPDEQEEAAEPGGDGCLVGTWRADHESFAGYIQDAFEQNAAGAGMEFAAEASRGDLLLTFTEDGQMSMSGEDFQVDLSIVGLANFTVLIDASGEATYAANGEVIASWNTTYESTGEGTGQVFTFPEVGAETAISLNPGMLFAYSRSENFQYTITGVPPEASLAPYSCQGDTLILGVEDYQPVRWERTSGS